MSSAMVALKGDLPSQSKVRDVNFFLLYIQHCSFYSRKSRVVRMIGRMNDI